MNNVVKSIVFIVDSLRFDRFEILRNVLKEFGLYLYEIWANSNSTEPCISTILTGVHPFEHEVVATGQKGDKLYRYFCENCLYIGPVGRVERIVGVKRLHAHYIHEVYMKYNISELLRTYDIIFVHDMTCHDYLYKPETKHEWHTNVKYIPEPFYVDHPSWARTVEKWIGSVGNDFVIQCYDYSTQCVGEYIAKILKDIDLEKTTVLITSDHGEFIGEFNLWFRHSISLEDVMVKLGLLTNLRLKIFKGRLQHMHIKKLLGKDPREEHKILVRSEYIAVEGTWQLGIRHEDNIKYIEPKLPPFNKNQHIPELYLTKYLKLVKQYNLPTHRGKIIQTTK